MARRLHPLGDCPRAPPRFVDGESVATRKAALDKIVPEKPPRIGDDYRKGSSPGMPLRASLQMLRLWSTPRTAEQLRACASSHPAAAEGLMAAYYFDGSDSDKVVSDHSASSWTNIRLRTRGGSPCRFENRATSASWSRRRALCWSTDCTIAVTFP